MTPTNISNNKHYQLAVDPGKNRVYLKIIGFWNNPEVVPNYLSDWAKTIANTKKGFTILTDASEMKTHPQELRKIHEQAQALILKGGVSKVAEIISHDVTTMQLDAVARKTQFPKKNFKDKVEAEKWLDE